MAYAFLVSIMPSLVSAVDQPTFRKPLLNLFRYWCHNGSETEISMSAADVASGKELGDDITQAEELTRSMKVELYKVNTDVGLGVR